MPITVTGARELVAGQWTHVGLHTAHTPGQTTELTEATAPGYARQPTAWETETDPELRVVPSTNPVFSVSSAQAQWPRVRSIAVYNGADNAADLLAWLPLAVSRLPDDTPPDPTLELDRGLLDALLLGDFDAAGFTDAGRALLYEGRVFRGHLALHTAAPTATNEIDGAGYERIDATHLLGLDPDIGDVVVRNNQVVRWEPAGTWAVPTHVALWSESTAGELWWSAAIPEPGPATPRTVPTETNFYEFAVGDLQWDFGLDHRVGFRSAPDRRINDAILGPARVESHTQVPSRYAVAHALEQVVVSSGLTEGALEGLLYGLVEGPELPIPVDPDRDASIIHPIRLYRYTTGSRRFHGMDIANLQIRWGFVQITPDPDPDYILFDPPFTNRCDYCHVQWGGHIDLNGLSWEAFFATEGDFISYTTPSAARVIAARDDRHRAAVFTESPHAGFMFWLAFGQ